MANNILDITFDLETCDVAPTAAPMQLAAVAWDRYRNEHDTDPFLRTRSGLQSFDKRCDLNAAVMDGFSFSQGTVDFWSRQPDETKLCVLGSPDDERLSPRDLYQSFFDWIDNLKKNTLSDHVVLWCQGQDFDIPMMKHCAAKYGLKMPFSQYSFRDCRTMSFETALTDRDRADEIFRNPKYEPYRELPPIPDTLMGFSHDALFDCIRSTWSTWNVMLRMRRCMRHPSYDDIKSMVQM